MKLKRLFHLSLLVLLALSRLPADAQSVAQPDPLFKTIQSLDTKLFEKVSCKLGDELRAAIRDDVMRKAVILEYIPIEKLHRLLRCHPCSSRDEVPHLR